MNEKLIVGRHLLFAAINIEESDDIKKSQDETDATQLRSKSIVTKQESDRNKSDELEPSNK